MRVAVAEAVIAQELSRSTFREFHSLKGVTTVEENTLGGIIDKLAKTHPLQTAIIRCQLAKICSGSTDVAAISAHSAERVVAVLGAWLGHDEPGKASFLQELQDIFSDATRLWQRLRLSSKKVTARMDVSGEYWLEEEDSRETYNEADDGASAQQGDGRITSAVLGPVAVLFPQILAEGEVLFHGYALFHTQHAVISAATENASHQDQQRQSVHRRRRTSNKDPIRPEKVADVVSADFPRYSKNPSNASSELSYIEHGASRVAGGSSRPARSAAE